MSEALTLVQIEEARQKIRQNARALLREARLLFKHRHFARAYALAHLSCEELARLPMLNTAAGRIVIGQRVDWKRLNNRMRNHRLKLRMLAQNEDRPNAEREARALRTAKNHSFYAEMFEGRYRRPSEVIRESDGKLMIGLASIRLRYYSGVEQRMRGVHLNPRFEETIRETMERADKEAAKFRRN